MADSSLNNKKKLISSFLQFLNDELKGDNVSPDDRESLEIGIQCIGNAFHLTDADKDLSLPSLLDIFQQHIGRDDKDKRVITEEDKAKANELKAKGNDLMKEGKYQEGLEAYTKAIELDNTNAIFYCNRAAAYSKLELYSSALEDCKRAIRIDPKYSKAYSRMGTAYANMNNFERARDAYAKAYELEPNETNEANLRLSENKLANSQNQNNGGGGGGLPNFGNFGSFMDVFNNPQMIEMATNFMSNPAMQNVLANFMTGMFPQTQQQQQPQSNDPQTQTNTASSETESAPDSSTTNGNQQPNSDIGRQILEAGRHFAEQMRQLNPELIEKLKAETSNNTNNKNDDDKENNK